MRSWGRILRTACQIKKEIVEIVKTTDAKKKKKGQIGCFSLYCSRGCTLLIFMLYAFDIILELCIECSVKFLLKTPSDAYILRLTTTHHTLFVLFCLFEHSCCFGKPAGKWTTPAISRYTLRRRLCCLPPNGLVVTLRFAFAPPRFQMHSSFCGHLNDCLLRWGAAALEGSKAALETKTVSPHTVGGGLRKGSY